MLESSWQAIRSCNLSNELAGAVERPGRRLRVELLYQLLQVPPSLLSHLA